MGSTSGLTLIPYDPRTPTPPNIRCNARIIQIVDGGVLCDILISINEYVSFVTGLSMYFLLIFFNHYLLYILFSFFLSFVDVVVVIALSVL